MASAKFLDFLTPSSPLVTVKLISTVVCFWGTPSQCRHHMYMPPSTPLQQLAALASVGVASSLARSLFAAAVAPRPQSSAWRRVPSPSSPVRPPARIHVLHVRSCLREGQIGELGLAKLINQPQFN